MCRHATPASLLLIDEFGKGTSSVDGVALLAATIRFLLRSARGRAGAVAHPPKTVITTHFREVFDYGLLSDAPPPPAPAPAPAPGALPLPSAASSSSSSSSSSASSSAAAAHPFFGPAPPHVSFLQMSVSFQRKADGAGAAGAGAGAEDEAGGVDWHEDSVTPLFKLRPGQAASSFGLSCARRSGVPVEVVRRAALVSDHMRRHEPLPRLGSGGGAAAAVAARRDAAALELAELVMGEAGGVEVSASTAARAEELLRRALAEGEK
jgi:hypothetical protein